MSQSTSTTRLPQAVRALIERKIQSGLELPLFPQSAAQVLELTQDEGCDARGLADLVQRDQALAGHVLSVSNSAAFAPKEPIVSLQQAISRLGLQTIGEIAVAISMRGRVFEVPGHQTRVRRMWMHSAATAVYAREVARLLRTNVEGAFLCGLLHDVGRPIVLQILIDAARERTERPVPAALLEMTMDEFHGPVGALTVETWKLAPWVRESVLHHHDPEVAEQYVEEVRITRLADLLSYWALGSDNSDESAFQAEHPVVQSLNLYGDDVMTLLALRGRVLEVAEAFA